MSLSINTNASALIALQTLNATQSDLSATENAVSTGKKVSTSADNAASYGIAQQMNGNISGQSAVNDGLSFASQIVSATNTAASKIISILHSVQDAVTSLAGNSGSATSTDQVSTQITSYLAQIDTIARDATVNGVNLLAGTVSTTASSTDGLGINSGSLTFVTGLQGDTVTISGFNSTISSAVNGASVTGGTATAGITMAAALGLTAAGTAGENAASNVFVTGSTLNTSAFGGTTDGDTKSTANMIALVQKAIVAMTNVTSTLGAESNNITNMASYGASISDNLTSGVSALTDADMAAESAKLTSLQTKQSLAIKALTIANGQSQNILSLYQ